MPVVTILNQTGQPLDSVELVRITNGEVIASRSTLGCREGWRFRPLPEGNFNVCWQANGARHQASFVYCNFPGAHETYVVRGPGQIEHDLTPAPEESDRNLGEGSRPHRPR